MSNTLIQFRVEDELKTKANLICQELGIDIQTYLRMSLARLVAENGIPFSVTAKRIDASTLKAALLESQIRAAQNETSEISLDEINEEINLARRGL